MLIYNTMSREKEELVPIKEGKISIYACGPTVYNLIHLGNARQICVFDVIRRYLKYRGYDVFYVQNFTDVDDKIIKIANEKNINSFEHAENMIAEYFRDAHGLGVPDADIHPKVSENIPAIIDIINRLIDKGAAYRTSTGVYFSVGKFPAYGKLSRNSPEELLDGASKRVETDEEKRSPADFALWKAAKEGEPSWEAPFGSGRPGWHIECSAMSRRYIGGTIDIHGGGADLIFPHHENEIAQSEAATGDVLAKYWVHNGMLNISNKKMSKSENNFFLVREAAEKYGYEPLRFMLLSAHYRNQMNYAPDVLESAAQAIGRLRACRGLIDRVARTTKTSSLSEKARNVVKTRREQFITAMDDDFNTADAIAALFELVRDVNSALGGDYASDVSAEDAGEYRRVFDEINGVLGLLYGEKDEAIPEDISALAEKRRQARLDKDFALADKIREEICAKGYIIEETRQGTVIKKA